MDLTASNYCQCRECQEKSGFDLCLGCNGSTCKTSSMAAREFCNEEHHLYLAYFAKDKFKVGTASSYRKYERLLEQGALYSIFLAKVPNGKVARILEARISNLLGIVSRVNLSYKMSNFVIGMEETEIEKRLLEKYSEILERIGNDDEYRGYFIPPIYNNFTRISNKVRQNLLEESRQLNFFGLVDEPGHKEYEKVAKPECISGEIVVTVGSLMLVKKDNTYLVVNMKNLEGWIVNFERKIGEITNGCVEEGHR